MLSIAQVATQAFAKSRPLDEPRVLPEGTTCTVKVQRGKVEGVRWMVYAQNFASLQMVDPLTVPTWVKESMVGMRKAYFHATIADGKWIFSQRTADQDW